VILTGGGLSGYEDHGVQRFDRDGGGILSKGSSVSTGGRLTACAESRVAEKIEKEERCGYIRRKRKVLTVKTCKVGEERTILSLNEKETNKKNKVLGNSGQGESCPMRM